MRATGTRLVVCFPLVCGSSSGSSPRGCCAARTRAERATGVPVSSAVLVAVLPLPLSLIGRRSRTTPG